MTDIKTENLTPAEIESLMIQLLIDAGKSRAEATRITKLLLEKKNDR